MPSLRFACPRSGREIDSGIYVDSTSLSEIRMFSIRLRCSACADTHEFRIIDGWSEELKAA